MKTTIFYAFIFLFTIFFASCQKENLIDSNKVKNESVQLKVAYVDNYTLSYIGNSQWSGCWHGSQLIFDGPADYQMHDGLQHHYNLSTSYSGGQPDIISDQGGNVWSVLQWLPSTNFNASMPKVDYISYQTGAVLECPPTYWTINISSISYKRSVSTYTAPIVDINGQKTVTFKCQIIEVDHVPCVCSPIKIASSPSGPPQ